MARVSESIGAYAADGRWGDVAEAINASGVSSLGSRDKSILLCELSYYGRIEPISVLLECGADPNYCYDINDTSIYKYILGAYPRTTALGQAILGAAERKHNTIQVVNMLLNFGANVNLYTYSGYTPLQLAIINDRPAHAELLLQRGADPELFRNDDERLNSFDIANEEGVDWAILMLRNWKRAR